MARETRIMGGFEVAKPTSVMGLESIKRYLEKGDIEGALKECNSQIEHRWSIDGYWANVSLVEVYNG